MKRIRKFFLWGVLLAGGIGTIILVSKGSLGGATKKGATGPIALDNRPTPAAVPVTVTAVQMQSIRKSIFAVGTLYGREEIPIYTKVEGRVRRIYKDVGDQVKPGDLLLELEPRDYELAVMEAESAFRSELAKLKLQELPDDGLDVAKMPMVMKTDAEVKNAQRRLETARSAGVAFPAEELRQRETEYETARAAYRQAVIDAETMLAAARYRYAILQTAKQRLADTKIYVPEAQTPIPKLGAKNPIHLSEKPEFVVAHRNVKPGEMLRIMPGENNSLFTLSINNPLKLMVQIPERYKPAIQMDQIAQLNIEAYPEENFFGTVVRISPNVDKLSRTFTAEIWVDNSDRRLSPGNFCRVNLLSDTPSKVKTVPKDSVVSFAGVNKIFVVRENRAAEVQVKIGTTLVIGEGDSRQSWVEVEGNLKAEDQVVIAGQSQLYDSAPITVQQVKKIEIPAAKESK